MSAIEDEGSLERARFQIILYLLSTRIHIFGHLRFYLHTCLTWIKRFRIGNKKSCPPHQPQLQIAASQGSRFLSRPACVCFFFISLCLRKYHLDSPLVFVRSRSTSPVCCLLLAQVPHHQGACLPPSICVGHVHTHPRSFLSGTSLAVGSGLRVSLLTM